MGSTPAHVAGPSLHWESVTDAAGRTALQMRWSPGAFEPGTALPVDPTAVAASHVPHVTSAA